MKKHLAAALVVAAAIPALWVTRAGAAVPTTQPKESVACPDGSGTARLWFTRSKGKLTKLAVDNPCSEFLLFRHEGDSDNGYETLAAPGSHFNWGKERIALNNASDWDGFRLWKFTDDECIADPNDTVTVVWWYNDVRPMSDAC